MSVGIQQRANGWAPSGGKHIPAIDGLRAVAVLSVVAYHAGMPAGLVGVDVFFVISGYLITGLLLDGQNLMRFYARRVRRILPAAILVVAVTLALAFMLLPQPGDVALSAAAAAAFVANLFFLSATEGYWAESAESMPLLHLWSLSVEEQFYLLWPFVLMVPKRLIVWGIAAGSFALFLMLPEASGFYQMPARAWELAAGGLVAMGAIRPLRGGLLLILLACLVPMPHSIAAPVAVLGAAMLLASIHAGHRVAAILSIRPMIGVGLISYSLYLWHWPLLAIDRAMRAGEAPLAVRLALIAISFVLAGLTYRYVEQPFRRSSARQGRAVLFGVACAAGLSFTAFVMADTRPVVQVPRVSWEKCHEWGPGIRAQLQPSRCVSHGPKVVLWGDSFVDVWSPVALKIANEKGIPVIRAITPSCPPVLIEQHRVTARASRHCRERAEETLAYLKKYGADTLIVAGWWAKMLRQNPEAADNVIAWAKQLPHVRRIIIIGAIPEVRDSVEKCISLGLSCDIARDEYERSAAPTKRMTAALEALPNVEVWEMGDWMCDADKCRGVRNGIRLYYHDNHHASREAVAEFLQR